MDGNNFIVENPKGIDKVIQKIQTHLFEEIEWNNCNVYGRIYKLNSEKGLLPRAFVSGKEYKDVFTDDRKAASIFFICDNQHATNEGIYFKVKTKIVFMVNLQKILSDTTKRIDTDVQIEAINAIVNQNTFTFKGELETGIDDIFKGFDTSLIKKVDLQPFHVFSINGEISYTISDNNCFK